MELLAQFGKLVATATRRHKCMPLAIRTAPHAIMSRVNARPESTADPAGNFTAEVVSNCSKPPYSSTAESGDADAMPGAVSRIELTEYEAIVLFEWLARFHETGNADFEGQAEQRALWTWKLLSKRALKPWWIQGTASCLPKTRQRLRDADA